LKKKNKKIYQREENKNYSSPVNSHKNNTLFALNTVNYNHHRKGGKNRKSTTITIPAKQRGLRARTKPQISWSISRTFRRSLACMHTKANSPIYARDIPTCTYTQIHLKIENIKQKVI
jgi:hypothetical protein